VSERKICRDDDGRPLLRPCPGCSLPRALVLLVLDPDERRAWDAEHGVVNITAAVLPPEQRAAAMKTTAELADHSYAMPVITCVTCGYDGLYVFRP
jgi:hypothetical protein